MTSEQYTEKRIFILEDAMRSLMMTLIAASPAIAVHIDMVGRNWDQALDRLESERAWANAALAVEQQRAAGQAAAQQKGDGNE